MNKQIEALKMAIDWIEKETRSQYTYVDILQACKEALEQPAQEPATWQSLSDDEIKNLSHNNKCWMNAGGNLMFDWEYFARAIEQALKEKNHA